MLSVSYPLSQRAHGGVFDLRWRTGLQVAPGGRWRCVGTQRAHVVVGARWLRFSKNRGVALAGYLVRCTAVVPGRAPCGGVGRTRPTNVTLPRQLQRTTTICTSGNHLFLAAKREGGLGSPLFLAVNTDVVFFFFGEGLPGQQDGRVGEESGKGRRRGASRLVGRVGVYITAR